jgi:hypothetical protein
VLRFEGRRLPESKLKRPTVLVVDDDSPMLHPYYNLTITFVSVVVALVVGGVEAIGLLKDQLKPDRRSLGLHWKLF